MTLVRKGRALAALGLFVVSLFLPNPLPAQAGPPLTCPDGESAIAFPGGYAVCARTVTPTPAAGRHNGPAPSPGRRPVTSGRHDDADVPHCTLYRTDPIHGTGPPSGPPGGATAGPTGEWMFQTCERPDVGPVGGVHWLWTGPGAAGQAAVDPGILAQQAFDQLRPSDPVVDFRPRFHPDSPEATLVGLRTFLWVDRGSVRPATRRAEVTATVQSVTFDPGDGSAPVVCPNGGTPYNAALRYDRQVADCWHIYARPSTAGFYQLRATVTWSATWTGSGGTGGVLPVQTTSATVAVPVQELQTVNSGYRAFDPARSV